MKALKTWISAAAVAATLAASAAPVHAAVIASFAPVTGNSDFKWVNNGANNNGTGGSFFSINSNSATSAQGVATRFTFLDPSLAALSFLPATMTLSATVATTPATLNDNVFAQTTLTGSFSFIYSGPTINDYMGSGIDLIAGSNLLSGTFTDAWIQGSGGSGSFNVAHANGGSAHYTSSYLNLNGASGEEFAFNLLSVTPKFGANSGKALKGFRGNAGGNFSADLVPEPATWAMMIMGFGGVGAMVRHRRRAAIAAI